MLLFICPKEEKEMGKQELVKTIREKAGIKNNEADIFIALNLPKCIAMEIEDMIKLRDIPEEMWFDLYHLIVTIVGNEISREDR